MTDYSKVLGKRRYAMWKMESALWRILNRMFRCNLPEKYRPVWIPINIYAILKAMYKIRVENPYIAMNIEYIRNIRNKWS